MTARTLYARCTGHHDGPFNPPLLWCLLRHRVPSFLGRGPRRTTAHIPIMCAATHSGRNGPGRQNNKSSVCLRIVFLRRLGHRTAWVLP